MTIRNAIKPAAGKPTPRPIHLSFSYLNRLRVELQIEMGKIQDHLNQHEPRHQFAFAAALNQLESAYVFLEAAQNAIKTP